MSSNLMSTEKGGEQTQYETEHTDVQPAPKSGGQLGTPQTTTDPSKTTEAQAEHKARGEKTAENMRYGQTISEGGVSGFTTGVSGSADAEEEGGSAEGQRRAQGYGGKEDHNREIGA